MSRGAGDREGASDLGAGALPVGRGLAGPRVAGIPRKDQTIGGATVDCATDRGAQVRR